MIDLKIKNLIALFFAFIFVCFSIYLIINSIVAVEDYKFKIWAGNDFYWAKEEPKKINDKCWLFQPYGRERFYCGDIYWELKN